MADNNLKSYTYVKAERNLLFSFFVFGTIGIFVKAIPCSSTFIAFARATLGALFLLFNVMVRKKGFDIKAVKKYIIPLIIIGGVMGFNWIFLFEAYNYTSVATATLCYYMAPIFISLFSPLVLKERLSVKKIICVIIAFIGMIFVSGVLFENVGMNEMKGIIFGLISAIMYAAVILGNKLFVVPSYERTTIELAAAAAAVFPYFLITEGFSSVSMTPVGLILLLIVGFFHTGFIYSLFFDAQNTISAQTTAVLSYLDPVVAIVLSTVILKENMGLYEVIGAALILGASLASEVHFGKE